MSQDNRSGHTRPLGELPSSQAPDRPQRGQLSDQAPQPWSVRFIATSHAIPIQLRVDDRAIIGRADPDAKFKPEIDLAPYKALERGVSRRHAELRAGKDYLMIIDRNSTNGTQLNGYSLNANEPYRLQHGDRLTIGTMELEVFVSIMPIHEGVKRLNKNISQLGKTDPSEKDYDRRRVLIVENDEETAKTLDKMVKAIGYDTRTTDTTGEAMRAIADLMPDCVIVELDMPDHPINEICRMIKEDLSSVHVPVFVLSDNPDEAKIREAFEAGADVFLSKPLGANELLESLKAYVGDPLIRQEEDEDKEEK